ncbi:hypothetical protein VH79_21450 [Salmonella enterica]|uniref:Uncharacterized protein n=1 Tax=Salmonella enterica TaxID=28901 RepID=A0A5U3ITR9_SALER|nr:hypothetical protein [Salmonella enterica]
MWRKIYQDALTASQKPATPEQRLVMLADLENTVNIADRNTRHNQKAELKRVIDGWIAAQKEQAMSEIKQRERQEKGE